MAFNTPAEGAWGNLVETPVDTNPDAFGATRLSDFFLGALVLVAIAVPGVEALPVGVFAMLILLFLAFTRRPTRTFRAIPWVPPLMVLTLAWLVVVTYFSPEVSPFPWTTRVLRLALVGVFTLFIASGRIDAASVVRGAVMGLLVNAVLFFAGIAPRNYGSSLSGYLLDKNVAGFAYACVAILAFGVSRADWQRWGSLLVFSGLVWTTGSRTALAGLALGMIWYFLRPRTPAYARWGFLGTLYLLLSYVESRYSQVGVFADRVGSDQLRALIDEAARIKWAESPWYGRGIAQAYLPIGDQTYLFHNSYLARLVEGGWPYLIVLLVLHLILGVAVFHKNPPASSLFASAEAANVTVLVCASRLGEVFSTTTAALVLGISIASYVVAETVTEPEPEGGKRSWRLRPDRSRDRARAPA